MSPGQISGWIDEEVDMILPYHKDVQMIETKFILKRSCVVAEMKEI